MVLIELYGPGSAMAATSSGGGKKALFGLSLGLLAVGRVFYGEFDPGSGRTLAACLRNASRTGGLRAVSGERSRNT